MRWYQYEVPIWGRDGHWTQMDNADIRKELGAPKSLPPHYTAVIPAVSPAIHRLAVPYTLHRR